MLLKQNVYRIWQRRIPSPQANAHSRQQCLMLRCVTNRLLNPCSTAVELSTKHIKHVTKTIKTNICRSILSCFAIKELPNLKRIENGIYPVVNFRIFRVLSTRFANFVFLLPTIFEIFKRDVSNFNNFL